MIDGLKPYPEYKDSNLPWVGKFPAHWQTERAKWLFTKMDRPVRRQDEVVTCFRDGMVTLRKNRRLRGFTEAIFELGYQGIRNGDLVIHAMDAFAGAVGVSDSDGKGSPVYAVCQPRAKLSAHYYAYIVREMSRSLWILALSRGIRERSTDFRFETFGRQRVPLLPEEEQTAMVRFLDHANGRIERAIRAKKKLMALLNEQKQAIIHRAVTRGLNPNVPLKPSGIPWLGDIPKHWELLPNRSFLKLRKQLVGERSKEFTLLSLTLRGVIARDMENPTGKFPAEFNTYQIVESGDLIFCLFDIDETPRFVGHSALNGMITGAYTVFRCADLELAKFVFLFYLAMDYDKRLKPAYTGLRKTIQKGTFLGIKTPIPPPQERQSILSLVETETKTISIALTRTEREIGLLREYRTRLVADVVTGKLDVRAAARQLPEAGGELAGQSDLSDSSDSSEEMPLE
jgi:type I restriction enzyme S subunit